MTDPTHAADRRRATAMVVHWGRHNFDGFNALLAEAREASRVTAMVVEILALHSEVVPVLLTEDGIACATGEIRRVAEISDEDTSDPGMADIRRAARLMFAYAKPDADWINRLLQEAVDADRAVDLVMSLLELYRRVIPQVYSEVGLNVLGRTILQWAADEQVQGS